MHSNQYGCSRAWRRIAFAASVCCALLSVISAEDNRWVWGKSSRRNGNYAVGGVDDGFLQSGGPGVLGGDGVKFGLNQGGYKPGGISIYRPGYPRPLPPPVYEGPEFGGPGDVRPGKPGILAGPGGPFGPGIGGPGIGGPGIGGPGIGGPGIGGPGIGGPGIGGPGIGGPGFGGPGIGPGIGGPGIGGPGVGPLGPGGHGGQGTGPGVLTGPIPSWEQERLDALGIGHRYISFDTCKCVHSFNCKSPGLSFGKCDKDKQYCCNGIRPGAVGHGVRKPPIGAGYPPPPPPPGLGGYGPGPIGEPGYGPEPYPGDLGFERSAKVKKA